MKYFKLADTPQYDDTEIKSSISALQSGKVDKADGMSLIEDAEKQRLADITNYDDTSVKADISALQAGKVDKVDGMSLIEDAEKQRLAEITNYSLSIATADTLGGVKVGSGLSITDGVLSTIAGGSLKIDTLLPWKWYSSSDTDHTLHPPSGVALSDYFGFVISGRTNSVPSPAYSFFILKECIEPAKEGNVGGGISYSRGDKIFVLNFGKIYSNSTTINCHLAGGDYIEIVGLRLK